MCDTFLPDSMASHPKNCNIVVTALRTSGLSSHIVLQSQNLILWHIFLFHFPTSILGATVMGKLFFICFTVAT
jgi:hypothetical protein